MTSSSPCDCRKDTPGASRPTTLNILARRCSGSGPQAASSPRGPTEGSGEREVLPHHSDDFDGPAVQAHGAAHDVRTPAEPRCHRSWPRSRALGPRSPGRASQLDLRCQGRVIGGGEKASEGRPRAQHAEEILADGHRLNLFRIPGAVERFRRPADQGDRVQRARLRLPVDEVARRHGVLLARRRRADVEDADEARAFRDGQRAQQDGADHAENGGIQPDPERQRRQRDRGEAGAP